MKLFIKFDINTICSLYLKQNLEQNNVNFTTLGFGEIEIEDNLDAEALENLKAKLAPCGFEVVENQKSVLVQKIKDAIIELVFMDDNNNYKSSVFLAEKLNHSYGYLSNVFSEVTYSSIENFIILQKIERAKQLIIINEMSLTEIAFLLNYSSVAHLSTQFKNTTGITPSAFQRIIKKRRENLK
ncbi:MAG: helix-turn-helix transcriptional regulator [Flavobacterium sp.]|uniref:DNA-binding transcriptional regulator AraC n=1 Tax=Flavobacterium anhuiense TaxID=459526 RepID=A0AAC9GGP3_9FLAO|nr:MULTISPECIES: AraC family transcriptional regulator [Flavobacterium]AOC93483.1 DNA-binding transcriptional regulator AraC [Flavobacterium anhuiense]EJG03333.1 helix-turn-helix domain-containing protein [Flavobacterium sp. F52]MBO9585644.1 helix-turn-helix transcriptional regulator [Flavobacterium sp.]URM39006.1 AraC family transcriptional regulator [Flavobacterium anhuiense]SCY24779.1 transcriptional regulator, AraC family [Flavobacterium anhuiense]